MSSSPYHNAGRMLSEILTHKKSLKKIAFKSQKLTCSKSTYAQVCNTLQHKATLDSILNHNSGYLRKSIQIEKVRNIGLVYILLYELLFGKYNSIRGGGALKRQITKMETELRSTKDVVLKQNGGPIHSVLPVFPRYVRINKLKATAKDVIESLINELKKKDCEEGDKDIFVDRHVPDLLCLSPKARIEWHDINLVSAGKIVLQDKSSCFSALALVHGLLNGPNGDYIDACAAPGNKTSHLASLIYDKLKMQCSTESDVERKGNTYSKVFAFDRSSERISILRERLKLLLPPNSIIDEPISQKGRNPVLIEPTHQDFLKSNPTDKRYANVKSILLDPSCSGSGIVNTPDRFNDVHDSDEKRIISLSNFQLLALKHAMSFDQVVQIV